MKPVVIVGAGLAALLARDPCAGSVDRRADHWRPRVVRRARTVCGDAAPLSVWNGEQLVLPQCPIVAQVGRWQGDPNATRVTLS